jgi:hypothetical protein
LISDISSFYIVQNDDVPSQDLPRRILLSFTVAASIAQIKRGQFEFKINVFLELLEDYKIDTETTMLRQKGWKPQMQLMIRIGTARMIPLFRALKFTYRTPPHVPTWNTHIKRFRANEQSS